jgi:anti-sigma B factor antagonist
MAADAHKPRLDVSVDGDRTVVRFLNCTSLNEFNADALGKQLTSLAETHGGQNIVLDLTGVEYLTSTVLGHMVALQKRLAAAGGKLSVENSCPTVRNIFHVTQLDQVLDVR